MKIQKNQKEIRPKIIVLDEVDLLLGFFSVFFLILYVIFLKIMKCSVDFSETLSFHKARNLF